MAYYFVVKQCLANLRFGAAICGLLVTHLVMRWAYILYTLTEQMDKARQNDEWYTRSRFYSQPEFVPNSRGKQTTTAISPAPTEEELRQWRMEWLESQALRAKSRQKIDALRHLLNRLADGFSKNLEGDIDPKHITPEQIQSQSEFYKASETGQKASLFLVSTSNDEEEPYDDDEEAFDDDEEAFDYEEEPYDDEYDYSDDEIINYCPVRSFQLRQLLRFLLALRSTSTAYYNFVMATIQEYDIDVMIIFGLSRLHDPIEGEEQWPPGWKRNPELCWWITQDVVKWMDEIPKHFKPDLAKLGIVISKREGIDIRILADDAASHIMIDSGDRLNRFRGPRF